MNDLMTQHEDVGSDASRTAAAYITVALAAAQRLVDMRARAADRRAGQDNPTGTNIAAGAGEPGPDRAAMAAMLGRDHGRDASSQTALQAWTVAQPHRDSDSEANLVACRAEDRLRALHPDAMARYDQLRQGLDPVAAMREIAPLITQEEQRGPELHAAPATAEDTGTHAAGGAQVAAPIPRQEAGQPEARLQQVVRDVLEVELASAVLTDQRWPQLAAALDRASDLGADPGALLRDVAAERELATAKSPAQVLEHRLDQRAAATRAPQRPPTAPTSPPAASLPPCRTPPAGHDRLPRPARTSPCSAPPSSWNATPPPNEPPPAPPPPPTTRPQRTSTSTPTEPPPGRCTSDRQPRRTPRQPVCSTPRPAASPRTRRPPPTSPPAATHSSSRKPPPNRTPLDRPLQPRPARQQEPPGLEHKPRPRQPGGADPTSSPATVNPNRRSGQGLRAMLAVLSLTGASYSAWPLSAWGLTVAGGFLLGAAGLYQLEAHRRQPILDQPRPGLGAPPPRLMPDGDEGSSGALGLIPACRTLRGAERQAGLAMA